MIMVKKGLKEYVVAKEAYTIKLLLTSYQILLRTTEEINYKYTKY